MPIISNTIQNNKERSSSITPRSKIYRSGNSSVRLQEGQTLKGVVSDIHGNEITLSMEDGSSFTGKLPDANQYSIGQKAAFLITGLADNTIYLKAITGAYLLNMEDTMEQALEEAGLPKTERNLDIVRSLLTNQQSISRDNILSSIRVCAQFPEADVNAIITMRRLSLPLTQENVSQFEQYQKQTHQFLYKMDAVTDAVSDMLNSIGTQIPHFAGLAGEELLKLALSGNASPEENALAVRLPSWDSLPAIYDADGNIITPEQLNDTALPEMFDAGGERLSDETLSTYKNAAMRFLSENAETEAFGNETEAELPRENTVKPDASLENTEKNETAQPSPFARMRQILTSITDGSSILKSAVAQSGESADYQAPFIHEQLGFILSPEERNVFSEEMNNYPLSVQTKAGIADGSATAREILQEFQEIIKSLPEDMAGALLKNTAFQKVVKAQFLSNWTISPEHLKDEGAVDELYEKISHQIKSLSKFSETILGKDLFSNVSGTTQDINQNLDFMRTLNQTFQYIQLPLKFQGNNAHGDLYVMTRKSSLKKDPNHLKALLHLDLEALGTLDIHITKENTAIQTHFYLEKKETKALFERNINLLADAVNNQGYAFTSELSMKEKDFDIVKDFVGADAPVGNLKRYNFDLRA